MKKKKLRDLSDLGGLVYSTDPDNLPDYEEDEDEVIDPGAQTIYIRLDKRHRKGKVVTLLTGFEESDERLTELGKKLKTQCGTGGSVKDGEIIIQGDFKSRLKELLIQQGYNVKISG
ncbi:MAG: translation initiation factor [Flavobacteriales bacterium]|nr:translation initiation factor [Bacteroidota bacterium]MCB9241098.1 translation initiation factor [Flavobacteriales bacterium]